MTRAPFLPTQHRFDIVIQKGIRIPGIPVELLHLESFCLCDCLVPGLVGLPGQPCGSSLGCKSWWGTECLGVSETDYKFRMAVVQCTLYHAIPDMPYHSPVPGDHPRLCSPLLPSYFMKTQRKPTETYINLMARNPDATCPESTAGLL